jgi:putative ABC transport system substrate-binding protein
VGFLSTRVVWERPQQSAAAAREAAQQLGILLSGALLEGSVGEAEYRRVFAAMAQDRVDALIVLDEPEHFTNLNVIVELAQKARLPAIYSWREPIELGGLMAYAWDPVDLYHQASRQIEQVLKGAKPQETPFYQSTKFVLILNLKAAKALGLKFPSSLLGSADEVIE